MKPRGGTYAKMGAGYVQTIRVGFFHLPKFLWSTLDGEKAKLRVTKIRNNFKVGRKIHDFYEQFLIPRKKIVKVSLRVGNFSKI